jgi:hypothetical protein
MRLSFTSLTARTPRRLSAKDLEKEINPSTHLKNMLYYNTAWLICQELFQFFSIIFR